MPNEYNHPIPQAPTAGRPDDLVKNHLPYRLYKFIVRDNPTPQYYVERLHSHEKSIKEIVSEIESIHTVIETNSFFSVIDGIYGNFWIRTADIIQVSIEYYNVSLL